MINPWNDYKQDKRSKSYNQPESKYEKDLNESKRFGSTGANVAYGAYQSLKKAGSKKLGGGRSSTRTTKTNVSGGNTGRTHT